MAQQSLRSLLEAVATTANLKNAAGEIRDPQTLLESGALAKLDARHPGAYVIFLFDAMADPSIAAYLATGSLSTDSGSLILALYERLPKAGARADVAGVPGLSIEAENPIVAFGRALFPKTLLTLPSLLVVKRLAAAGDCVSVALEGSPGSTRTRSPTP